MTQRRVNALLTSRALFSRANLAETMQSESRVANFKARNAFKEMR